MPQVKLENSRHIVSSSDVAAVEQLQPVGPAGGVVGQHGIGREQGREHHDVAQQEQPEAEAGDDSIGAGPRSE